MSLRSTNEKRDELVLKNIRFVHYVVNKLKAKMISETTDYDDLVSIGTMGLIKAADTFDESKHIKFITYAGTCIRNEILMSFRKSNKQIMEVSLDEPIAADGEGHELTVGDTIPAESINLEDLIVEQEVFEKCMMIILNNLNAKERLVALYKLSDLTQLEIAKKLNFSQSYVSRLELKITKNIKSCLAREKQIKEVYSMKVAEDLYEISFLTKDVGLFNVIFADLFKKLANINFMPDFTLRCNKERVVLKMAKDSRSFYLLAELIQQIDDFKLTYESNEESSTGEFKKTDEKIGDTIPDAIEEDSIPEISSVVEDEESSDEKIFEDTVIEEDTNVQETPVSEDVNVTHKKRERNGDSKMVEEYILGLSSFEVKEIKKHFPQVNIATINNVIQRGKREGVIISKDRGEYEVIKK